MPHEDHALKQAQAKQIRRAAPHGQAATKVEPLRKLEGQIERGDAGNANFVSQCGRSIIGLAKIGTMKT